MPAVRHRKGKDRSTSTTTSSASQEKGLGKRKQHWRPPTITMEDIATSKDIAIEDDIARRSSTSKRRRRMIVWKVAAAAVVCSVAAIVAVTSTQRGRGDGSEQPTEAAVEHSIDAVPSPTDAPSQGSGSHFESSTTKPSSSRVPYTSFGSFRVLDTIPHNPNSFTQGFCLHNNGTILYEGTGLYGQSVVQIVNVSTGEVLLQRPMTSQYFGEGLTYYPNTPNGSTNGRLVQLTWKEQTGFVYDATTLQVLKQFNYSTSTTEGWGIAYRNRTNTFVVSDGSDLLLTWNRNFTEINRIRVTIRRSDRDVVASISWLNELEWDPFTDTILANVWQNDVILRINPQTGFVTTMYDLSNLYPKSERSPTADVLNGIAVTDIPNIIWVTGKQWPFMYRIRLYDLKK